MFYAAATGIGAKKLQEARRDYEALDAPADLPPGRGALEVWLGEAELGRHHYAAALEHFQSSSKALAVPPGKPLHDAFRCQLVDSEVKTGADAAVARQIDRGVRDIATGARHSSALA